jgi:SAM-dependent methyltransferase
MRYSAAAQLLPGSLRRHILHFEGEIEDAVAAFAREIPDGAKVLDAGAGEGQYASWFRSHRYCGVDLGIGDAAWNYGDLDAIADLTHLPFRAGVFAACLNIVTLEHVRDPACVVAEIGRILAPGGRLLLIVPHEWEVHQAPHDFFRYTRYGVEHLLRQAGFTDIEIAPVGGYFRLLARRLLNGLQFFSGGARWLLFAPAALLLAPPALILPALDFLDRERNFTLGYICVARKS